MPELPIPPFLQVPLAAFVVAVIAALLIRLIGGPGRGADLAGAALGVAVLATWMIQVGLPVISPRQVFERIPVVALGGLVIGFAMDSARVEGWIRLVSMAGSGVLAAWWMVGAPGVSIPFWQQGVLLKGAALAFAWLVVLLRLGRAGGDDERTPLVMLLVAAAGLAGIAHAAGGRAAPAYAGPALIVAGAALGLLVLNWPSPRFPFGAAPLLAGGGALMAAASALWLAAGGRGVGLALLLLGLVFFAEGAAARLAVGQGLMRRAAWPLVLGVSAALPAALAALVAFLAGRIP